ncbi:BON domain-containing protein [Castellaniella sp. S9]|uniref:BON domain-containing protein n=1 Tax=Castellaniella sp. S9 TaxID=2993652 RepID=UPI0022B5D76F|nr:BON domain-containing protein [Castellaniella sp. S9]
MNPALFIPTRRIARWGLSIAVLAALSGCGLLVVGGTAATTAVVATDRRTAGEQVDDQTIELRVASEMNNAFGDKARVLGTAYAGRLLLVGDVPAEADRARAESLAQGIAKVTHVDNYIRVGDITPLSVRTNDTWLTSKVKAQLVRTEQIPSRTIKITTERGVVYLMGKVTDAEGQRAATVASGVEGVNKVVKLFQIVTPASIAAESGQPAATDASTTPAPDQPTADEGVQAMPVK